MTLANDTKAMINGFPEEMETVWYVPISGGKRQVNVLVNRNVPQLESIGGSGGNKTVHEVHIVNSAVDGVAVPKASQDQIHMKKNLCDDVDTVFRVTSVESQDTGAYILLVTA